MRLNSNLQEIHSSAEEHMVQIAIDGNKYNAAGGLRHDEQWGRGTKGDADSKHLVTCFLRERQRREEWCQCSEMRSSFLFLGEVLVVELVHVAARCGKGCGRFLKSRDKELLCGVGGHTWTSWTLQKTRLHTTAGSAAAALELCIAGVGPGGALGTWFSGRTRMLGRGVGSRGNIVLGGRRCIDLGGGRSGKGAQIPEFEAVAMGLIIARN
jgi:hypothetical protein